MLNLYIYDCHTKYSDIYSSVYTEPLHTIYIFSIRLFTLCATHNYHPVFHHSRVDLYVRIYFDVIPKPSLSTIIFYHILYRYTYIFLLSPSSTEIYTALPSSSLPPSLPDIKNTPKIKKKNKKYTVPYNASSKFPTSFVIPILFIYICNVRYTIYFRGKRLMRRHIL